MQAFGDRRFQLWEYRVSHGSLLVRSPKRGDDKQNIDIAFAGVEYVAVPRHLKSLVIDEATPKEVEELGALLGKEVSRENVTILVAEGKRHPIVAAGKKVEESDMEMFDSPFTTS